MPKADLLPAAWMAVWPQALAAWSPYAQLCDPELCLDQDSARDAGALGGIALIRLVDQRVVINLPEVQRHGLDGLELELLAHEVGHHMFAPGNLADHARCLAGIGRALPGSRPDAWALVANLWTDLLINDRLQGRGLRLDEVYRRLGRRPQADAMWLLYLRAYEVLWRLAPGDLRGGRAIPSAIDADALEGDAQLIARMVRHFATRWIAGARRFAVVLRPWLEASGSAQGPMDDLRRLAEGRGSWPDGISADDDAEEEADRAFDIRHGLAPAAAPTGAADQCRQPFEVGQVLEALGMKLDRAALVARYYKERALPHLLPFPGDEQAPSMEPHPEGWTAWEATDDLERLDLPGTLARHGVFIPGVTTLQRVDGAAPGKLPQRAPLDLDLYLDCSGSMPDPGQSLSHLALAGMVLALSALRAGARVQATLWSGPGQFETTGGFVRDEAAIIPVVCGYLGGCTAFPLHVLRDSAEARTPDRPRVHVVVISDDGVDTMLARDERGQEGPAVVAEALRRFDGGGTLVLNLGQDLADWAPRQAFEALGLHLHRVRDWAGLIAFARAFVRQTYRAETR